MLKSQTQIAGAIEMPIDEWFCNKHVKLFDFCLHAGKLFLLPTRKTFSNLNSETILQFFVQNMFASEHIKTVILNN